MILFVMSVKFSPFIKLWIADQTYVKFMLFFKMSIQSKLSFKQLRTSNICETTEAFFLLSSTLIVIQKLLALNAELSKLTQLRVGVAINCHTKGISLNYVSILLVRVYYEFLLLILNFRFGFLDWVLCTQILKKRFFLEVLNFFKLSFQFLFTLNNLLF
jgi:hypothetical protein